MGLYQATVSIAGIGQLEDAAEILRGDRGGHEVRRRLAEALRGAAAPALRDRGTIVRAE